MKTHLFEAFAKMIAGIPAEGILSAVELEHWMLEDDLLYKRVSETKEVASILSFCKFIYAVIDADRILPVELPPTHVEFYRKTLMRLIEAGKLPGDAKEQFDLTFSSGSLNIGQ